MKQHFTYLTLIGALACSTLACSTLAGCSLIDNQTSGSSTTSANSKVLIMDQAADKYRMDALIIKDASVIGDSLTMLVAYSGGCKPHDFKVVSNGAILKTMPPQINVQVSHNAHDDMCEAMLTQDITVSLEPIKRLASSGGIVLHLKGFEKPLTYQR